MTGQNETLDEAVRFLRNRAQSLRDQSRDLHPLVASAYRRRAAELDLAAFVGDHSADEGALAA